MKIYYVRSYVQEFIDGRMFENKTLYATEEVAKKALKGRAKWLLRDAKKHYSLDELTIKEDERSYSIFSKCTEWTVYISEKTILDDYFEEEEEEGEEDEEEEEEEEINEEKLSDLPGTEFFNATKPFKVEKATILSLAPEKFISPNNGQWNSCHDIDKIKKKKRG